MSKNNCFGDSAAVHALLGAISVFFSEKVFFSLVNALLRLADFFLKMCHFTAESVGERDAIQHRCI